MPDIFEAARQGAQDADRRRRSRHRAPARRPLHEDGLQGRNRDQRHAIADQGAPQPARHHDRRRQHAGDWTGFRSARACSIPAASRSRSSWSPAATDQETAERCESLGLFYGRKGPEFWKNIEAALTEIYPNMAGRDRRTGDPVDRRRSTRASARARGRRRSGHRRIPRQQAQQIRHRYAVCVRRRAWISHRQQGAARASS